MPTAIQDIKGRNANWLVLAPTWSVSRTSPFVFSPVPGVDALWVDNLDTINHARASNLSITLFPAANLPATAEKWWQSAPRDPVWWEAWFDCYAAFAAYHADLATKASAQVLVLGGEWVAPALPGGQVNGGSSGVPADAEARWAQHSGGCPQALRGAGVLGGDISGRPAIRAGFCRYPGRHLPALACTAERQQRGGSEGCGREDTG